jgi:putative membrane protein
MAYKDTQGDGWDAHKDMALASLGALLTLSVTLLVKLYLQRDFAREWAESLPVKQPLPLGEKAIPRLWRDKHQSKTETEDKRQ